MMAMVAVFCIMTLLSSNAERDELRAKQEKLEEVIAGYNEEILSLENDLEAPFDDAYVMKVARKKLNMRMPDEIVYYTNISEK